MNNYKITITQTKKLEVEIAAPTPEEAEELALKRLNSGEIKFPDYYNGDDLSTSAESVIQGEIKKWLSFDDYAAIQKSGESYEWTLYKEDFGDSDLVIDGKEGFGYAGSFKMSGFTSVAEAFETANAFYCSEFFPFGDAEIEKRGDHLFWRDSSEANSEWSEIEL